MKNLVWILGLLLSSNVFAAASVYSFNSMKCEGIQFGRAPHVGQDRVAIIASANEGAVQIATQYFSLEDDVKMTSPSATWEVNALFTDGRDVFRRTLANNGDGLHLKITSSVVKDGIREDRLEGAWLYKDAPAGRYGYHLRCVAYGK